MGRGVRRRPKHLGGKLQHIRDKLDLTQAELIERFGLTGFLNPGEISDFERSVREPDLLTLKAYADGAGISTDDLIDDNVKLSEKLLIVKSQTGESKPRRGRPKRP